MPVATAAGTGRAGPPVSILRSTLARACLFVVAPRGSCRLPARARRRPLPGQTCRPQTRMAPPASIVFN